MDALKIAIVAEIGRCALGVVLAIRAGLREIFGHAVGEPRDPVRWQNFAQTDDTLGSKGSDLFGSWVHDRLDRVCRIALRQIKVPPHLAGNKSTMTNKRNLQVSRFAPIVLTAWLLGCVPALALTVPKIDHAPTAKECGACHMVYPPQLLPQRSWEAIMSNLGEHFGDNAVLPDDVRVDILAFLAANAADAPDRPHYRGVVGGLPSSAVPLRITELPWFRGRHGEVNLAGLANTKIKSAANCVGCHAGAAAGVYVEPGD
jgi:hypothetical protein